MKILNIIVIMISIFGMVVCTERRNGVALFLWILLLLLGLKFLSTWIP